MRVITATMTATIIALAAASGPALARTADAAKPAAEASPPACHAYEQNPDGSWKEIGCAENGVTPAPARVSTRNESKASR
jgi:hypothetical protein